MWKNKNNTSNCYQAANEINYCFRLDTLALTVDEILFLFLISVCVYVLPVYHNDVFPNPVSPARPAEPDGLPKHVQDFRHLKSNIYFDSLLFQSAKL